MNTSTPPVKKVDTKALLSTLWIVVMINMLKEGVLSLYILARRKNWHGHPPARVRPFPS